MQFIILDVPLFSILELVWLYWLDSDGIPPALKKTHAKQKNTISHPYGQLI